MARQYINVNNLIPNQKYAVRVKSIASDGTESEWSQAISFKTVRDITPPSAVTAASLNFDTTSLIINWDGSSAKLSKDFKDFEVKIYNFAGTTSATYYSDTPFVFTLEENAKTFGSPTASLKVDIKSRDRTGNLSSAYTSSAINPIPTEFPTLTATGITRGFSASWNAPTSSFTDYAYTEVYASTVSTFAASTVAPFWRGNGTYAEYTNISNLTTWYVKARHFDIFGQAGPDSLGASITPVDILTVKTTAPENSSALFISASNDGGATAMSGFIFASWSPSNSSDARGYRLRYKAVDDTYYQTENTASNVNTYQINNLIPGYVYQVEIATVDYLNNTSSWKSSSPSSILIPYGTVPLVTLTASAAANASIIILSSSVSSSWIGLPIAGNGIVGGTIITGSIVGANTASATISQFTYAALSGASVTIYPGIANWQSYITAGLSGSYMKFGTGVNGLQHGVYLDTNNYWYTSGNFKVGSNTSYLSWDGQTASITGNIGAAGGSFTGNVQVTNGAVYTGNSPNSGSRVVFNANGIGGYNSAGSQTFLLEAATGNLYSSAGYIGGWQITSTSLVAGTSPSVVGLIPNNSIAFFAGSSVPSAAPFTVTNTGRLKASNANISGSISASYFSATAPTGAEILIVPTENRYGSSSGGIYFDNHDALQTLPGVIRQSYAAGVGGAAFGLSLISPQLSTSNQAVINLYGLSDLSSQIYFDTDSFINDGTLDQRGAATFGNTSTFNSSATFNSNATFTACAVFDSTGTPGPRIRIGDDIKLGDVNYADTLGLTGMQNSSKAYIKYGNDTNTLGFDGTNFGYFNTGGTALLNFTNMSGVWTVVNLATAGVTAKINSPTGSMRYMVMGKTLFINVYINSGTASVTNVRPVINLPLGYTVAYENRFAINTASGQTGNFALLSGQNSGSFYKNGTGNNSNFTSGDSLAGYSFNGAIEIN